MQTVLGKKKVPLPQIKISDCIPYTVVPKEVTNLITPFSNLDKGGEIPFTPCRSLPQDKTYGTIRMSRRTPKEIEVYKKKQTQKEKSPLGPNENKKN